MYTLKQIPDDFIVKEVSNIVLNEKGRFTYVKLTKRGRNTQDVVSQIASQLHLKEGKIGFAGSKDKNAVTEQLISIQGRSVKQIEELGIENCSLEVIGFGKDPITLGDLEGNSFEITVRNINDKKLKPITKVVNYFDEQRFSTHNVEVGRFMVKKKFKDAVALVNHYRVREYLAENKTDAVGALKRLPMRLLKMYVHAYQSYLWNETVAAYLKEGKKVAYSQGTLVFAEECDVKSIPLIGFDSGLVEKHPAKEVIKNIMEREHLMYKDFVIKAIPQLSMEGELRSVFADVKDMTVSALENDELNQDMKKVTVSFTLGKGSYATMVVKRVMV
ncbi:TPA: tRNA pseudouridine(13) synthase TruD [Candidatus Woesearchaeota archaeon]|nr:tRNA pseudouridine(13) synthase TruD [Candidatus Woesearchaeota archaeon]